MLDKDLKIKSNLFQRIYNKNEGGRARWRKIYTIDY